MYPRVFATLGLLGLAACGGSSTNGPVTTVDPVSPSGFATANSIVTGGSSFDVQNAFRLLGDPNGNIVIDGQDLEYIISDDGSTVTVVVAGETYVLEQSFNGYTFSDGSTFVNASRIFAPIPEAEIVDVFAVVDNNLNDATFVIGFDTDPAEVAALSGTAQMNGEIFVTARNDFDVANGEGDVTIDVNFNTDTISGDFNIRDSDDGVFEFAIPTSSFALESTDIVGNGFTGDISLTSGDIDGTITSATYTGRFFGEDARAAGGQIVAQIDSPDFDSPTFVEGAFLAVDE